MTQPSALPANTSACRCLLSHLLLWFFAAAGLAVDLWTKHLAFTRLSVNPRDPGFEIVRGWVYLRRSLNPGALFGLGKGLVPIFIVASVLAMGFVLYLFVHSARDRRSLHVALGLVLAGALGNFYDRVFAQADVVKVVASDPQSGEVQKRYHSGTIIYKNAHRIDIVEGLLVKPEPEKEGELERAGCVSHISRTRNVQVEARRQGVVRDFIRVEKVWPWVFNLADAWLVIGVGLLLLNFWWERRAEQAAAAAAVSGPPPA